MDVLATTAKVRRALGVLRAIAEHPLSRGRRFRAVARWLGLFAASHLTPTRQIAVPYVEGAVLHWPAPATSVMLCARYGLGEYADMAFCLHLLRQGDLFCDVGANAGVYTVLAAHAVGCRVIAAEPVPATFNLLMQNIHANALEGTVDARRVGVGREAGRLFFTSSLWSYNHVVPAGSADSVEVDVLPLDTLLGGRVPTMLKIDVEGFEEEVIAGAASTLSQQELLAVLVEMCGHVERYGGRLDSIAGTLRAAGLSGPFWYDPVNRVLTEPGTPSKSKYNQIFVRHKAFVEQRLAKALQYEVNGAKV